MYILKDIITNPFTNNSSLHESYSKTMSSTQKPHAICIPYPAQGHINPMLKLAKLLHHRNFFITFVNTEYNHRRLMESCGPTAVAEMADFRFATIPESEVDVTKGLSSLIPSLTKNCLEPFCELIERLNSSDGPPVTCIVADGTMSFTLEAARRFGLTEVLFWTISACGLLGYTQFPKLIEKGYIPLRDMSQVRDGYLNTVVDWVPGMNSIKLKDFPSFIRTTDRDDPMLNFILRETGAIPRAKALILNTFDALEKDALHSLSNMFTNPVYTVGPLQSMLENHGLKATESSLLKEDNRCIEWLDTKEPGSVLYVNFGSITIMTPHQLMEFAWGLANSKKPFLLVVRPELVATEDGAVLTEEFVTETKDRSMTIEWCDQERVLRHPSIGGFLTHSGWNSTIEAIISGIPIICWPFFSEQHTNCRYSCIEWEIGLEIGDDVKRDEVERVVNELMDGEKGKKIKDNVRIWKRKAEEAVEIGGSSYLNLDTMIKEVLSQ